MRGCLFRVRQPDEQCHEGGEERRGEEVGTLVDKLEETQLQVNDTNIQKYIHYNVHVCVQFSVIFTWVWLQLDYNFQEN